MSTISKGRNSPGPSFVAKIEDTGRESRRRALTSLGGDPSSTGLPLGLRRSCHQQPSMHTFIPLSGSP